MRSGQPGGGLYEGRPVLQALPEAVRRADGVAGRQPVPCCCSVESVKYLFKYIYKGHDRQMVRTDRQGAAEADRDEIAEFQDLRSIGASEAC